MSSYTAELVEQLLPAVWDDSYAYGMSNPSAPEQGMPRTATAKNEGGTLAAHIADIKATWAKSNLTHKMRVAVVLYYGLGWTLTEVGYYQGDTHQAASKRLKRSVELMTAYLNGKDCTDEDDD